MAKREWTMADGMGGEVREEGGVVHSWRVLISSTSPTFPPFRFGLPPLKIIASIQLVSVVGSGELSVQNPHHSLHRGFRRRIPRMHFGKLCREMLVPPPDIRWPRGDGQ